MNTKERIARIGIAAAIVGSGIFYSACGSNTPTNHSETGRSTLSQEIKNSSWEKLSSQERLQKLARKEYSTALDFNPQKQLLLAVGEEFTRLTSKGSGAELGNSVKFANESEFIAGLSRELGTSLSETEAKKEMSSRLAITTSTGEIIINQILMNNIVNDVANSGQIGRLDSKTIIEVDTLVHELIHKEKKAHIAKFKAFSLVLSENKKASFDTANGFILEGKDPQGKTQYLLGGDEAITDLAASIIVRKMGLPYFSTPEYKNGAMLVKKLNQIANVSDDEFLKFVFGDIEQAKLLEEWGSHRKTGLVADSDLKTGTIALGEIALATQGLIKFQEVEKDITTDFK